MLMTTPEIDLLKRLYVDEAMTISQIAARIGVAAQTVHNRLVAAEIPRRPSPSTPRVDVRDAEIRRLYVGQQLSAVQIAAHLGCGTSTVYSRLAGLGIARRSTSGSRSVRPPDDELRQLYEVEGQSLRQIAQRFQVTPQAVHGWVRAADIDLRPPGSAAPEIELHSLAERYLAGASGLDLARHHRCSPATIYRRLEEAGVDRRKTVPAVDPGDLVDGLVDGLSAPGIAERRECQRRVPGASAQQPEDRNASRAASLSRTAGFARR